MQNMKTEKQNILLSSVVDHTERQGANPFKTLRTERIGESLDHVNNTIHCHKIGLTVMEQQTHIHLLNEELNNLTWS